MYLTYKTLYYKYPHHFLSYLPFKSNSSSYLGELTDDVTWYLANLPPPIKSPHCSSLHLIGCKLLLHLCQPPPLSPHTLGIATKCAALCGDRSAPWQALGRVPSWAQAQERVWIGSRSQGQSRLRVQGTRVLGSRVGQGQHSQNVLDFSVILFHFKIYLIVQCSIMYQDLNLSVN